MAEVTYQIALRGLNQGGHTYAELETMLGLKHGGQGKSLRRYITGERRPSEVMQMRIQSLYQALLRAHFYCAPFDPDTIPYIRREYRDKVRRWNGLVKGEKRQEIDDLGKILQENYYSSTELDYGANCFVNLSQARAKPRFKDAFRLDDQYATERPLLMYLIEAAALMKKKSFAVFANGVLEDLKDHKPSLYRELRWVGEL
jgi:hypothetical protein